MRDQAIVLIGPLWVWVVDPLYAFGEEGDDRLDVEIDGGGVQWTQVTGAVISAHDCQG